jgi:hypothetical protein
MTVGGWVVGYPRVAAPSLGYLSLVAARAHEMRTPANMPAWSLAYICTSRLACRVRVSGDVARRARGQPARAAHLARDDGHACARVWHALYLCLIARRTCVRLRAAARAALPSVGVPAPTVMRAATLRRPAGVACDCGGASSRADGASERVME